MEIPETAPPAEVELDRDRMLRVRWDDVAVQIPLADLRAACPCAECRGRRERGLRVPPEPGPAGARGAQLVGNWGLQVSWQDGHETGIYSWALLRAFGAHDATGP